MFIFQIDPAKSLTAEGSKGVLHSVSNPDSVLLNSLSQTPKVNLASPVKPSLEMLLGKIMDLANEYIIYAQTNQGAMLDGVGLGNCPWNKSNALFDALAQYTDIPATKENITNVKSFFCGIMQGMPQDPNGNGMQDYGDVLTIWGSGDGSPPVTKGDINGDGTVDRADLIALKDALKTGDLNGDGKLDVVDQQLLKNMINGGPITDVWRPNVGSGDLNHDGQINQKDLDILGYVLKAGDMNNDKKVDKTDLKILTELVGDKDSLTTIKDLSKGLLEDPYHHLTEIPKLGKALAKYTNTEYDLRKADSLFNFFLHTEKKDQDVNGDGQVDYQDVIVFWKSLDKIRPR